MVTVTARHPDLERLDRSTPSTPPCAVAVAGLLARAIMPGKQGMGIVMTGLLSIGKRYSSRWVRVAIAREDRCRVAKEDSDLTK